MCIRGSLGAWNWGRVALLVVSVKKQGKKPPARRKGAKVVREAASIGYNVPGTVAVAPFFDRDNITIYNDDLLTTNKGGQQSVCADITTIAKSVGWKYHSTIIWNEQNISRRTAWGSWLSASAPFVIAPVEVIVVLYKDVWKKTSGSGVSDATRGEFMGWTNGVWSFNGESKKRVGHPAPFPVELPRRCIKLFSFVGDTVLDPFLGSGTTLLACFNTKRRGIGLEIGRGYCQLAVDRLAKDAHIDRLVFQHA
jgi:site-specific DNA-methyltransferase (adenine-specific)